MTNEERIYRLKQIEKDINVCSLDATFEEISKSCAIRSAIEELEERKTGKWIFGETMGHSWMKCSECCKSQDGQTLCFTYCPNCGAKMEGEENGTD